MGWCLVLILFDKEGAQFFFYVHMEGLPFDQKIYYNKCHWGFKHRENLLSTHPPITTTTFIYTRLKHQVSQI